MKNLWRNNGLTLVLLACFFIFWGAQTLAGWRVYNDDQQQHHQSPISLTAYLGTGHWMEATFENWESEFLQMGAYVVLTVFLYQKGSAESKDPDQPASQDREPDPGKPDAPAPVKKGGLALKIYSHSLSLVLLGLFVFSFAMHALGGAREYSHEQIQLGQNPVTVWQYLGTSQFWFESFQNWQSEFLAVASLVVLSIFLRQKGSPESKPVDAPGQQTGSD